MSRSNKRGIGAVVTSSVAESHVQSLTGVFIETVNKKMDEMVATITSNVLDSLECKRFVQADVLDKLTDDYGNLNLKLDQHMEEQRAYMEEQRASIQFVKDTLSQKFEEITVHAVPRPEIPVSRPTLASNESEPYATAVIENEHVPLFLPEFQVTSIQLQKSIRGVIRIVLRHFHEINELQRYNLTGTSFALGDPDDDEDKADDEMAASSLAPPTNRVPVPHTTVVFCIAAVKKRFPVCTAEVQIADPLHHQKLVAAQEGQVRVMIGKVLQYFRDTYTPNGELIRKKEKSRLSGKKQLKRLQH